MAPFRRSQATSKGTRAATTRSAEIDDHVASQIEADGPGLALAVVESDSIVHAAGYGLANVDGDLPIAQDTIFHLASCGKQFTGFGIVMLAEERKLRFDDPIGRHLPELAGFGPGVTIRQLLHHTSGIRDLYDEDGSNEILDRFERPTNADVIRTYADLGCPMAGDTIEPGDEFSYSNSGYELLGAVIERASQQSYHDFFQTRVFDRLGMKDTFSVPDRRAGNRRCAIGYVLDEQNELIAHGGSEFDDLVGSGSFYTTASDLYLYDRSLRANGLVSEASMREVFTSGQTNDGNLTNYGFGWYLGVQDDMYFADHEGSWNGFRSYICHYLDRPLSIFMLSNLPELDLIEIANVASDAYA